MADPKKPAPKRDGWLDAVLADVATKLGKLVEADAVEIMALIERRASGDLRVGAKELQFVRQCEERCK